MISVALIALPCSNAFAQSAHSKTPMIKSCKGLVVTGYQGWFRTPNDNSRRGWVHWNGKLREFSPRSCTIDFWPYTKEYEKLYDTGFTNPDGTTAQVFSSYDYSTVDTHFKWMKQYGIDAAFMQRFYGATVNNPNDGRTVISNAYKAAQKYKVGIMVMYDISGMPKGEVAQKLIDDWKYFVDTVNITGGDNNVYVRHNNKPLVCVWGIGFNDRHFSPEESDINKFFDFLKNDERYGNCSIMIGVPTAWRTLDADCIKNPKLHEFLKKYADIISPWNIGRYHMKNGVHRWSKGEMTKTVEKDIAWCEENNKSYLPTIYPGFSWYNLQKVEGLTNNARLNQIPREKGKFFWNMAAQAVEGGAEMLYYSMFDEVDEGTAIFKISNTPPSTEGCPFADLEGMPEDHYLFLAGKAKEMLKNGSAMPMPKR